MLFSLYLQVFPTQTHGGSLSARYVGSRWSAAQSDAVTTTNDNLSCSANPRQKLAKAPSIREPVPSCAEMLPSCAERRIDVQSWYYDQEVCDCRANARNLPRQGYHLLDH